MSTGTNGGVVGSANNPTSSTASGIWTIEEQKIANAAGTWPETNNQYQISRSLRFNSADSAYLGRTPASAGNRRTWTYSFWMKRALISSLYQEPLSAGNASGNGDGVSFNPSNQITIFASGGSALYFVTSQVFRDVSSWYHIVVSVDTTQATSTDRVKLYVNGTQVTAFSTATYPSQNFEFVYLNTTTPQRIGTGYNYLDGYLADIHFIDGQALTPSSFGETDTDTGVWKPKAYTGSYGTNGFHLDFSDNSSTTALGYDAAGSNDWTPNNFSVTAGAGNDSLVDTPTSYGTDTGAGGEVRGNYCTINPLINYSGRLTFANGNLDVTGTGNTTWETAFSTMGFSSGKWYTEVTVTAAGSGVQQLLGICEQADITSVSSFLPGSTSKSYGYYSSTGNLLNNTPGPGTSYGASYTTNDVIGIALDMDAGTLTFYKNGTSQGQAASGLSGTYFMALGTVDGTLSFNAGQRPFAYTAPSGFKALCTQNLPEPTVVQGDDYFNTVLYTGDNTSNRAITGYDFAPDLIWLKSRSNALNHRLVDAVQGVTSTLASNLTTAAVNSSSEFISLNSNGFTVTQGASFSFNASAYTYAAWGWNAGGSTVTNTAGTISAQVRANQTAGFSIVTYSITSASSTISTFGHGLGTAPSMVILKVRNAADSWTVYHSAVPSPTSNWLTLNSTAAAGGSTSTFSSSSTTFGVRETRLVGSGGSGDVLAYCFSAVPGFSAFGSYTGNGSADGPFVYTGFRPAFVLIKTSSTSGNDWYIFDDKRETEYNPTTKPLFANGNFSEQPDNRPIDLISNGFKVRYNQFFNASGATMIYAAFAENPFKYSLAR